MRVRSRPSAALYPVSSGCGRPSRVVASERSSHIGDAGHVLGRRIRQHAVPEIEDERPVAEPTQQPFGGGIEARPSGPEQIVVEIALHRAGGLQLGRGPLDGYGRIDTDGIDAGVARVLAIEDARAARKPMIGTCGWLSRSARTICLVGAITHLRNSSAAKSPAQLSNSCTASAPAAICRSR